MFPLRLSLFALLLLTVLGLSQEAEADAPTIELLTPQSDSGVPASSSDNYDIYFTWNSTDADDDALVHKVYFGTDRYDLDQIGSTTDEVLKYTTDIVYNTAYYWKASADDGGGEVFSDIWDFIIFENGERVQWDTNDNDNRYHGVGVDNSRKTIFACGTYVVSIFEFTDYNPIWHYETSNNDEIFDCDFSQEDYFVFGMSYSGQADGYGIELYHIDDTNEVEQIWKYETEYVVRYTTISDDGENIAVGFDENLVSYFSKDSSTPLWTTDLDSHESQWGPNVLLSHNKEFVIARIADKIYSLDTSDGNIDWTYDVGGDYDVQEMAMSSKNDLIVMTLWGDYTNSSTLYFVNNSDTPLWNFTQTTGYQPKDAQFSDDGNHVVTCLDNRYGDGGIVRIFSDRNSTPSFIVDDSSNNIDKCSISDNGDYLAYFTDITGPDDDASPAFLVSVKRNVTLEEFGANTPSGGSPSLRKAMFTEDGEYLLYIYKPWDDNPLRVSQNFIPVVSIDSESEVLINQLQVLSASLQYSKNNVTDFSWDVDGVEYGSVLSVTHIFTEERTYQVTFSAKDIFGHNSSVFTKEILAVRQPTIEITNNPARYVNEGDQIFNCVADVYGTIQTYEWNSSIDGLLSTQKSFVTQLSNGSHNISVRVQDNYGFWSDYDYVNVKVSGLPWISEMSVSPNPAELDEVVSFNSASYVEEGSVIAWNWSSSLDGPFSTSESFTDGTLSLGTHTISLFLESDIGNRSQTFTRTLIVMNSPPVIGNCDGCVWPNEGVYNEFTPVFDLEATDFHAITYEWSSDIDGVLCTSSECSPSSPLSVGTHEITLTVTDEYSASTSSNVGSVWVKSRPTVTIIVPSTTGEYSVSDEYTHIYFAASVVDEDYSDGGGISACYWTVDGVDFVSGFNETHCWFPYPLWMGSIGVHNISVFVKDNNGLASNFAYLDLTILDAPYVSIDSYESLISEGQSITLTALVSDTDSTSHTFVWTSDIDGDLGDSNPITISSLSAGQHIIGVRATDDDGLYGVDLIDINVGKPPTIDSVTIPDTVTPSLLITLYSQDFDERRLDVNCTATDEGSLNYKWDVIHVNQTLNAEMTDMCYAEFDLSYSGDYIVNLTVTDTIGLSSKYGKIVNVLYVPTAKISPSIPIQIESGNELTFTGSAYDEDGDIVSYTWESDIDGVLSLKQSTTTILSPGHHQITFSATDNDNLRSHKDSMGILVFQRPIIFLGNDIEVDIDEPLWFNVTVNILSSDIIKYEWDFNGDGVFDWSSPTTGNTAYKYDEKGVYEAKLQVTDSDGIASNSTRTIAVATELPQPKPETSSPLGDSDNTLLLAAVIIGASIVGAAVVMSRKKTEDPYAQPYPEPTSKAKEPEKKVFTAKKKKVTKAFKPKADLISIECPGCDVQMKVPKLNKMQEVTCKECGLSGEIEI